ncbi:MULTISPECIES: hypothetical protein [unclassified Halomonas]|uniref:hypothetical protein n=1 Tax=unclassified Halomonas TaxID=2609666 RepID=UPI0013B46469|nr:hypothetical protein [Halomonas sp. BN3-1]MBR9882109.1 hypothetical protein [Gammaproteobacteria bacterium]|tara:strand:- start:1258 stop:1434 length:177 start_codon:yes stop_codon:yes gene_type:complete
MDTRFYLLIVAVLVGLVVFHWIGFRLLKRKLQPPQESDAIRDATPGRSRDNSDSSEER